MISTSLSEAQPRNNVQPELRSLWSAIAGGGFKLHYVDANGVRTRSMEAGDGQQRNGGQGDERVVGHVGAA